MPSLDIHENKPKLSVCSLEELCPGIDRDNMPEEIRDRKQFAKLGQWKDSSGKFVVGLALTGGSESPWQPVDYNPHNLIAYVMFNGQEKYPYDSQWSVDVQVFVSEPEAGAKEHLLERERTLLGFKQGQKTFPIMFQLNTERFLAKLQRYDSVWQFSEANMIYTIDWEHTKIQRPNVSGIRKVLEVTELMLLVCDYLDLRSIEALRQTCKHFRGMQPLADVGRTRVQNALLHFFNLGDRHTEEQRDRIVKSFNALLLAGGGNWLPADLDIVVRYMQQEVMEGFLTEVGFVLNEERSRLPQKFYPGGEGPGEAIKFTYRRFENPIEGRAGVDLCVMHPWSISAPAEFVLTYHSTVVMNFWTGSSIHCLWPDLTINGKLLRNQHTPTPKVEAALMKYAKRGFYDIHDTRPKTLHHTTRMRFFGSTIRYLQDDYPDVAKERLTIETIPGHTWRKELIV
ncbi:hypothetical protein C8R42DRAFT_645980 [Lentinula raphanica]|nr:hypothetical protein C8R42DRAFT_645980 [Lentinula raphanica]